MPNIKSIKYLPAAMARLLLSGVLFLLVFFLIETIIQGFGVEETIKPRSKLAKFFYVSETARVPILLGFTIILAPVTLAFAIKEKLHGKH